MLPAMTLPITQVLSYVDVLRGNAAVGRRVAVIGAGGIGFDVSEYLLGEKALERLPEDRLDDLTTFLKVNCSHKQGLQIWMSQGRRKRTRLKSNWKRKASMAGGLPSAESSSCRARLYIYICLA